MHSTTRRPCKVVIISLFCGEQGIFSQSFFSLGSIWQLKLPLHSSTHPSTPSPNFHGGVEEKGEDKIDVDADSLSLNARPPNRSIKLGKCSRNQL